MSNRIKFEEAKPADPSDACADFGWIEGTIEKLGWCLIAVAVKYSKPELERVGPGFEERIGQAMEAAGLGMFDSLKQGDPFVAYFIAGKGCVPKALTFLKDVLEADGLIGLCRIAVADGNEKQWRQFYPAMPES